MVKAKLITILFICICMLSINQGLWLDEAIGALAAREFTYREVVTKLMLADNHPPLYYLLLKGWTSIFGFTDFAIRMLSVIAGGLSVYMTYKVALLLTKNKQKIAVLCSLFLATSQFYVYYSQEARMYIFTSLFALCSIYYFLRTINNPKRPLLWVGYSFSITALMFTDYVPVFLIPVFWIYPVFAKIKDFTWWRRFIISHLVLLICGLIWLPILEKQIQSGQWLLANFSAWKTVAGGANLKQALLVWIKFTSGRISLIDKKLYYLFVFIVSVPMTVSLGKVVIKHKKNLFLLLWLSVPLVLGFVTSIFFPAFIYFRFVYIVPALAIAMSVGLFSIKNRHLRWILLFVIIFFNVTSLLIYQHNSNQKREQWREAVLYIEQVAEPDSVVLFEFPEPFAPFRWYTNGLISAYGATNSVSADEEETINKTRQLVDSTNIVYHFEYLRDLSDPKRYVENTLVNSGFIELNATSRFVGVGKITKWVR